MKTLYRKVAVSERLPEKQSFNFIKYTCGPTDSAFFSIKENKFYARRKDIEFWLEEIPDTSRQIEKLEAEKKELLDALMQLCDLKQIKDMDGKTPYYLEQQPLAWTKAKSLIKKHKK